MQIEIFNLINFLINPLKLKLGLKLSIFSRKLQNILMQVGTKTPKGPEIKHFQCTKLRCKIFLGKGACKPKSYL